MWPSFLGMIGRYMHIVKYTILLLCIYQECAILKYCTYKQLCGYMLIYMKAGLEQVATMTPGSISVLYRGVAVVKLLDLPLIICICNLL